MSARQFSSPKEPVRKKQRRRRKVFKVKYFGVILGLLVVILLFFLYHQTQILRSLELTMTDVRFQYRNLRQSQKYQEGVTETEASLKISNDIIIAAIDFQTLDKFGKWPFPRWQYANFLNFFSRISNQDNRESATLLDIFFVEPDKAADDLLLLEAIEENGRVFLETVLDELPPPAKNRDEYFSRQQVLYDKTGEITAVSGNINKIPVFYGLQPPLRPYGKAAYSYGHANFVEDYDQVYRRQPLVVRSSVFVEEIPLDQLTPETFVDYSGFERLEWQDKESRHISIDGPLTPDVIERLKKDMEKNAVKRILSIDKDGNPLVSYYAVYKYKDHIVPAITLSLALKYFNKTVEDIEIVLGEYIRIPNPQIFNYQTGALEPYAILQKKPVFAETAQGEHIEKEPGVWRQVPEIKIPIDESGKMLINFMGQASLSGMGEYQTYPVRSFSGYAGSPIENMPSDWPDTRAHENKILMVGAFEKGIADDQKTTPYGLMYGIEIHANALNTILMENFIVSLPSWLEWLLIAVLVVLIAFISSRLPSLGSFLITVVAVICLFLAVVVCFDNFNLIINFSTPAVGMLLSFATVLAYRAMTEEKDKRMIKSMFGTYLSPKVVEQIIEHPPELGGLDKNLTVFFSDIRGFTTLSESLTPQELVGILNKYLSAMTDIILEHDGTLDKYEGDAIMAFWGAPVPLEDHAFLACKASIKQLEALKELNKTFPPDRQINIGIGLNTGIMTVGNMGSSQRMDYTLIGDNVNLGSRLEGTNKAYGTQIIISEYTYEMVKDKVVARELDNIRVKGKNKPVLIYELVDIKDGY